MTDIMFLDISFLGAAAYRKEGYARIYSTLRKERSRKSVCVDEPLHYVYHDKYGHHHQYYDKNQAKLDITLRYYHYINSTSHDVSREARKNSHNKLNESFKLTNIQRHYLKYYARKHAIGDNKVSKRHKAFFSSIEGTTLGTQYLLWKVSKWHFDRICFLYPSLWFALVCILGQLSWTCLRL